MQEIINAVYQQYPWASEATATDIANNIGRGPANRRKIALAITNAVNPAGVAELDRLLKGQIQSEKKQAKAKSEFTREMQGAQRAVMTQNVDGLGAMTGLFEKLAGAASELGVGGAAAGAFGKLGGSRNKLISGLGQVGRGATEVVGSSLGIAAGIGTFVAAFINGQDKLLKTMIDIGLADYNMENMTQLRNDAASLGMGFNEYAKVLQVSANLIGAGHDSAMQGATIFSEMATRVARDESVVKFGYRTSELTMRLAQTADALYKSNQINKLDAGAEEKILRVFQTTQAIALGLATTTGENRSKLLDELENQRQDVELNTSFQLAQQQFVEQNGQQAFDNLRNGTQMYLANIASRFGKDSPMYAEIEKTVKAAVYDINYDQNIMNNITPELAQMFNEIGGGALNAFIEQGNNLLAGNTDEAQSVVDASSLLGILSDQFDQGLRRFASVDPITNAAAQAMAAAKVANDAAKDISLVELKDMIDESTGAVGVADESIVAIDNAAIALTTTLEAIMPGIDTMDGALDMVYATMGFTASMIDALTAILGIDGTDAKSQLDDIMEAVEKGTTTDAVIYQRGSKEYNRQSSLLRLTPDGDITARSYENFINTTRTFMSDSAIGSADRDTLTDRVSSLTEMKAEVNNRLANRDGERNAQGRITGRPLTQQEIALYNQQLRILDEQITKVNKRIADQESVLEGV